jgi:hypothetical protein
VSWALDDTNRFTFFDDGEAVVWLVPALDTAAATGWLSAPPAAGGSDDAPAFTAHFVAAEGSAGGAFPVVPKAAVVLSVIAGSAAPVAPIEAVSSADGVPRQAVPAAAPPHFAGLGAYFGGPGSPQYQASLAQFVGIIGQAPNYIGTYVDYTQPLSAWVGNAQYAVSGLIVSSDGGSVIPVVGLPMISLIADGESEIQNFNDIANGLDDSVWIGVVKAYEAAGYKTIALRPGFEMNGGWYPWGISNTAEAQAYVAAFQHIANVVHNIAGITVDVVWNVSEVTNEAVSAASLYPGNQYVDTIGLDLYSALWPTSFYDWSTHTTDASFAQWEANPVNLYHFWLYPDANQWTPTGNGAGWGLADTIKLALADNKPLALPETGESGNGSTHGPLSSPLFPQFVASALLAAGGPPVAFVDLWDSGSGTGTFTNGSWPVTANAWAQFVAEMSSGDPGPFANSGGATVGHGQTVSLGNQIAALIIPSWAGLTQSITAVSAITGKATLGTGGTITYVAPASGSDTVSYTVKDQFNDVASFAFAVTVDPGPQSSAGGTSVVEGTTVQLGAQIAALITPGIAGDTETVTTVSAANGTAVLGPAGAITYTAPTAPGSDTLTYGVADQYGDTASFRFAITVTAPLHAANAALTISAAAAGNLLDGGPGMSFLSADAAGGDVFMLNAPGAGITTITGFDPTIGDILDLSRALAGVTIASDLSNIGLYLTSEVSGGNTTLLADPSGMNIAPVGIAVLNGVSTTVPQLLQSHDLSMA